VNKQTASTQVCQCGTDSRPQTSIKIDLQLRLPQRTGTAFTVIT